MRVRSVAAITGVLGGVLVLASGCAAGPPIVSPGGTATPGPQVSAVPARVITIVTPKARTAPPALKNTGTSWPAILASLAAYSQWSLANPDPVNIATVAEPGCSMANLLAEQTAGLLGSRLLVRPIPVVFAAVIGPSSVAAGAGEVILHATASRPAEPVLDRKGKQISTFQALPQTSLEITLNRGGDQKWRFCSIEASADARSPVALL